MRFPRLFALLALLIAPAAHAQRGPCSDAAMIAAGSAVTQARIALVALPVEADPADVTPQMSAAIERVKDRVQHFVRLALRCSSPRATPGAIQAVLTAKGGATAPEALVNEHGKQLGYSVERVSGRPNWIAVMPTIAIECGEDSMLTLFERQRQGWREVISRRSRPYGSISDGWEGLDYAVSPPDGKGRWYLAIASTTPWCQSAWRGLRYDLSRPEPRAGQAHIFFSKHVTTYVGEYSDAMHAKAGIFEIRHDGHSIDMGVLIRKHVERYDVAGDRARRIQPVAYTPRDFVDEWIVSPWTEASSWSTPGRRLKVAHAQLAALNRKGLLDFGAIRRCAANGHQVEVEPEKGVPWYVLVGGTGSFTVRAASPTPSPRCR